MEENRNPEKVASITYHVNKDSASVPRHREHGKLELTCKRGRAKAKSRDKTRVKTMRCSGGSGLINTRQGIISRKQAVMFSWRLKCGRVLKRMRDVEEKLWKGGFL